MINRRQFLYLAGASAINLLAIRGKRNTRSAGETNFNCHNLEHEDMGMMRNYLVA